MYDMPRPKPLILIILDGFGVSTNQVGNPVMQARIPIFNEIERSFPFTTLQASGVAVGLPWGEAGNSEVGHLTIGSGRAIYHHLPRIINSINDGSFFQNEAFAQAANHVRANNSRLHIAGLVSSGSVHSYIDHLYALLEFTQREGVRQVFIHAFTDGKDASPREAAKFFTLLEERILAQFPHVKIASVIGRFYALDRDDKWERTRKAYELIAEGRGEHIGSISNYIENSYSKGLSDEFIEPGLVVDHAENPIGLLEDNDVLIFSDFREDSMRQISHAFTDEVFDKFPRKNILNLLAITMTEYKKGLRAMVAFPQIDITRPLSKVLSDAGLAHLHIAETQKYAHVTYFFNGGQEKPFPKEDRIMIPSVSNVHFDEVPEMQASRITRSILESMEKYDVIIANFANADMVGHTGNFEASVRAIETLDESLGQIMNSVLALEGVMVVTADHGNIELKRDVLSGEKRTEHSTNPVPFYLVGNQFRKKKPSSEEEILKAKRESGGIITDVAPTIISILGLEKPEEMTGASLLSILLRQV